MFSNLIQLIWFERMNILNFVKYQQWLCYNFADPCASVNCNNGVCVTLSQTQTQCNCNAGWIGEFCDSRKWFLKLRGPFLDVYWFIDFLIYMWYIQKYNYFSAARLMDKFYKLGKLMCRFFFLILHDIRTSLIVKRYQRMEIYPSVNWHMSLSNTMIKFGIEYLYQTIQFINNWQGYFWLRITLNMIQ